MFVLKKLAVWLYKKIQPCKKNQRKSVFYIDLEPENNTDETSLSITSELENPKSLTPSLTTGDSDYYSDEINTDEEDNLQETLLADTPKKKDKLTFFTDASKKKRKSGSHRIGWGFVVYDSNNNVVDYQNGIFEDNYSIDDFVPKLGYRYNDHNVNSAEIGAISKALQYAENFLKTEQLEVCDVEIYSDSKEALNYYKHKTPKNTKMAHVYGHTGVEGNEIADQLAKGRIHNIDQIYQYIDYYNQNYNY